jgi:hypothetical protein
MNNYPLAFGPVFPINPQFGNQMVMPGMMFNNQIPNQIPPIGQGINTNRQNIPLPPQNLGGLNMGGMGPALDPKKKLAQIIKDKATFIGMDSKDSKRLVFPSFKFAV